ncbi:MAG: flagellar assembly protein FliW [Desulfobacterales bacterium]|nr:flagellar assembly protein FliW [Desulfobacterales bacterium]
MSNSKMAQLKKINTRFGEVEYDPEKTIHFPMGMLGFKDLHEYIVMPNKKDGPLFWLQSVEDPEVAFVLTDPTNFFLDYRIAPDKNEQARLAMREGDVCHVLSVVTVQPDRKVTLNLQAPILYAPAANRALQIILDNSPYGVRTPLPEME